MPRLFISYKRGTPGIKELIERLEQQSYAIWFDRFDIRAGARDWQAEIDKGIASSDALILCLTEDAAKSQYVKHEIQQALSRELASAENRTYVFPVLMQPNLPGERIAELLTEVGLYERQQCPDLSMVDDTHLWNQNFESFIKDLHSYTDRHGRHYLRPTRHDFRTLHPDTEEARMYTRFARRMIDLLGRDSIRTQSFNGDVELDKLIVIPPTDYKLVFDIADYDIKSWWIMRDASIADGIYTTSDSEKVARLKQGAEQFDLLQQAIAFSVSADTHWQVPLQLMIEDRREALHKLNDADKRKRLGRLDDVWEVRTLNATVLAAMFPRVLFIGDAGTGKTFFARYLTVTLADEANRQASTGKLEYFVHKGMVPLFIKAGELAQYLDQDEKDWNATHLLQFVKDVLLANEPDGVGQIIENEFQDGECIILIDELDTLFTRYDQRNLIRQEQIGQLLRSATEQFSGIRILLFSRSHRDIGSNSSNANSRLMTATITPLAVEAQRQVIENFFTATAHVADPEAIKRSVEDVFAELHSYSAKLTGNPSFITLFAKLYPERYGLLYRQTVELLIHLSQRNNQEERSLLALLGVDTLERALEDLVEEILAPFAYETLDEYDEPTAIPEKTLRRILLDYVNEYVKKSDGTRDTDKIMQYITQDSGIMVNHQFANEGFRHYLAATKITKAFLKDPARKVDDAHTEARELVEKKPHQWQESLRIVGDLLPVIGTLEDLPEIIDDFVDDVLPETVLPADRRWYSTWLAARIAVDQSVGTREYNHKATRIAVETYLANLEHWLSRMVETPGAPEDEETGRVDLIVRSESARLLGRLNDRRTGVGCDTRNIPSFDWVRIPAGEYTVGLPSSKRQSPDEAPERHVHQESFLISRYPVTYRQYAAFVSANGYSENRFWSAAGIVWKQRQGEQPFDWDNSYFKVDNHPVINITWYEAQAYCAWLNTVITDAQGIALPTEVQWEIAARGHEPVPAFTPAQVNGRLTGIGRTTAVGLFPESASPFGCMDMVGNVYEWCVDVFEADQEISGQNEINIEFTQRRMLRGGSWRSYPAYLSVTSRYPAYPYLANNYWGFRVVASSRE